METNTRVRELRGYLRVVLLLVVVAVITTLSLPAWGTAQEVCPEQGKVEANGENQNEINDLVLEAGTEVCIKGSNKIVYVTADGESSLIELLGSLNQNGKLQDVSHYTVLTTTTTTTIPEETTTTTLVETTTTTLPTTTLVTTPGSMEELPTVIIEPFVVVASTTTSATPTTLPFTGPIGLGMGLLAGITALALGTLLVRSRALGDEE